MNTTPLSLRKHIVLLGAVNAGKSSLFNALLEQKVSIVSDISGTTTDPVVKTMELIPYGPVALIDTAGTGDTTSLGAEREGKTKTAAKRGDLFLYVVDSTAAPLQEISLAHTPNILVFAKCDCIPTQELTSLKEKYPSAEFISTGNKASIDALKKRIILELEKQDSADDTFVGGLLPQGSVVLLVTPIDSAAPKGRLILPQVQILRDCLDNNLIAIVCKETELADCLEKFPSVNLVITDSQVFKLVDSIVPHSIPLTSFSMLLAKQKGNFAQLLEGVKAIPTLRNGANILVLEGCTHNQTHEDIGKVKIPALLKKQTGKSFNFTHLSGYAVPDHLEEYSLVIQCGSCMLNKAFVADRQNDCLNANIPITNYGVVLAYLSGILDRAKEIFM